MTPEQVHVRRTLNWLIRPALVAAIALTLYGNIAQAQPSVGGWVSHGWAPTLYLVLVEILVRKAVGGGWFWPVLVGFIALAVVAGIVSFASLTHAAEKWGWSPGEAWLFPLIVDLTAVLLTMASVGAGARIRELSNEANEAPAEPKPGRPVEPNSIRSTAKRKAAEPKPEPNGLTIAGRIIAEFGTEPNDWPQATALAERFGCSKSTASTNRKKASQMVAEVTAEVP
jgi:hypothetical protein